MTALRVSHLSDARQVAKGVNSALRKTDAIDLSSDQGTVTVDRAMSVAGNVAATGDLSSVNANLSGVYKIAGVQVLGPRQTGWAADTGTALKASNATYVPGAGLTYSASYTQSELTATGTRIAAMETALQNATQEIKAIKDALLTHGAIGP